MLGIVTSLWRDGDPQDPGSPEPYCTVKLQEGPVVDATYSGDPPAPWTWVEVWSGGPASYHVDGSFDLDSRLVFHEDFLTMPDTTPAGTVASTARSTAPGGWLLCYGQAVSRTTYAELFAAIGTTFGTGDGSTTFNLPDLRGRVPVGLDNMGGSDAGRLAASNTLGGSGGAETHTLSLAESPAHTHGPGSGTHFVTRNIGSGAFAATAGGTAWSIPAVTDSQGGGGAHNNMQPYLLLNHIIKT